MQAEPEHHPHLIHSILRAGLMLAVFAIAGGTLLALTHASTRERIAYNERAFMLQNLNEIVPASRYDNDLFNDVIQAQNEELLGSKKEVTIYRARREGKPVAAIIACQAPDGYNGSIRLLVGVNADGTLAGVRVSAHRETPGLGDGIDLERSDWILQFTGRSLNSPAPGRWAVRKDGGDFDQFTGATITPRAVVKAVHNSLVYFSDHQQTIFALAPVDTSAGERN